MIQICTQCGALLMEDTERCAFCDAPLGAAEEEAVPISVGSSEEEEPEWRREVARRLEHYRARRRSLLTDDSQTPLPFSEEPRVREREIRPRERLRPSPRARQPERLEIEVVQPELDFSAAREPHAHPALLTIPVAPLSERRFAGALDAVFLLLTYAGFWGLFRSLGGQLVLGRVDILVSAVAFFLFYAIYFSLFTTLTGTTPGMQFRGLYIVRMDGALPATRPLLWRSFGYVLSGATLALGFFWALWDEEHLTWHDRISQTYVTATHPLGQSDAIHEAPGTHRFSHR